MQIASCFIVLLFALTAFGQQVSDTSFHPEFDHPLFPEQSGPVVYLDEAHENFHTVSGRYAPFVQVLREDGFIVRPNDQLFSAQLLTNCRILVIANALHPSNNAAWTLPTPTAFTPEEIAAVKTWVMKGGSLFLIADHMPFAGAASDLAGAFGFTFFNGFAMQKDGINDLFTRNNGRLADDSLIAGIVQVQTFTGQAFRCPAQARPLLVLDSAFTLLLPQTAWDFENNCSSQPAAGMIQLAILRFGEGKVVVSGEAAMFSAQLAGNQQIGLTAPEATDNLALLRKLMQWLAG